MQLSLADALALCTTALTANRVSAGNAEATAAALVRAEADGQRGHGLSRVPAYAAQARAGKVDGMATPVAERAAGALLRIDANHGFAYPAIDLALNKLPAIAREQGIALAAIRRSHHFGQAGAHVERLAEGGLVALMFGNSPKAIAFWGGSKPMMGTNPIAFAAPLPDAAPLVIDLALSTVARGKIAAAAQRGETIPEGWALDADGQPTTDPQAALAGSMVPIGEAKGAALVMAVELMAAALTGSHFGYEASSFFDDKGGPPSIGQLIVAIDPELCSGAAFVTRMQDFCAALAATDGARLPGTSRLANRRRAEAEGIDVPDALAEQIAALANRGGEDQEHG